MSAQEKHKEKPEIKKVGNVSEALTCSPSAPPSR